MTDNRLGFGALVGVVLSNGKTLWRQARTDGSYLSASDSRVHFGLGAATAIERVIVRWPSGKEESWATVKADRQITLRQQATK